MSVVVWKFEMPWSTVSVNMPRGATILSVGECDPDEGGVCLWALCNPDAPLEARAVLAVQTGDRVPPTAGEFIGSMRTTRGQVVWHVFAGRV